MRAKRGYVIPPNHAELPGTITEKVYTEKVLPGDIIYKEINGLSRDEFIKLYEDKGMRYILEHIIGSEDK